jgi:PTH1 family peptidyl-tRNA hydrolase
MALFQKKPQVGTELPLYSVGAHRTVLIIGLGNPGEQYEGTRHNIGFAILDDFAKKNDFPGWVKKPDLKSHITAQNLGDNRVVLCKPQTFMNLSGESAQAVQHFYRIYNQSSLAVYDELAIPFGQLRTRVGGSDAGHNGVKSLIQHLGDDFGRLRVGVGSNLTKKANASDYVLGKFTKAEQANLSQIVREANSMITEYIFGDQLNAETRTAIG